MTRIALLLGLCAALPAVTFAAGKPLHGPMDRMTNWAPLPSGVAESMVADSPLIPDGFSNIGLAQDANWGQIPPEYIDFNQSDGEYDRDLRVFQRSDGGYWVAGLHRPSDTSVNDEIAIAKLDANGNLDTSYGSGGKATIASGLYVIYDVAMNGQDQLFFTGEAHTGAFLDYDFAVQCVDTNGSPCADFASTRTYFFDQGGDNNDYPTRIIHANGSLYVVGTVQTTGTSSADDVEIGVIKISDDNGDYDVNFGDSGKAVFNINFMTDGYDEPFDLAYAPTGKLVIVGDTQASTSNDDYDALTLVINANSGAPDTSFAAAGYRRIFFDLGSAERFDAFTSVTIRRNGDYLVAGYSLSDNPESAEFTAAEYQPDGSLNPAFAQGGDVHSVLVSLTNVPHGIVEKQSGNLVSPLAIRNDVLGTGANDTTLTAVVEFDPNITTVLSLQTVQIDGQSAFDTEPAAIMIDRQQRMLVGGWRAYSGTDYDMWVNRYLDLDVIFVDGFDSNN